MILGRFGVGQHGVQQQTFAQDDRLGRAGRSSILLLVGS
jgi:hypothetical protein